MSADNMKKDKSHTDWEALENMTDDEIDFSDIPLLDEEFFKKAVWRIPGKKKLISIRLDPDVLEWFKAQGKGQRYQTHINAVLRAYVKAKKTT